MSSEEPVSGVSAVCSSPHSIMGSASSVGRCASGFFGAGGRLVDQWPLCASYFGLVGSRPGRATFGPCSLHHSATSFSDRFVLPDLGAMRVQLALDALCSGSAWLPPCGLGGDKRSRHTYLPKKDDTDNRHATYWLAASTLHVLRNVLHRAPGLHRHCLPAY